MRGKPSAWLRPMIAGLGLAASVVLAGPAAAQSLKQALASAYLESGLLDQNRALLRAADEDVAIALSALRPVVNFAASTTRSYNAGAAGSSDVTTQSLSLTVDLLVYDFGRSPVAVEAAKANVLATRQSLISVEQQVLARAVSAFMGLRAERSSAELQRNNLRLLREELRAARDRFEVGEITRTDVAFAEARVAASQAQLAAAEASVAAAEAEYRAAIGQAPGRLNSPPNLARPARTLAEARASALQRHPDILAAQQNVTAAELNIRRAELGMRPSLSAQGRLSAQRSGTPGVDSESGSVGLTLSAPLYQGGQLAAAKRRAAAQRDAARAGLHLAALSVEQNLANAWARLEAADASLVASREQARASQTAFDGIREEARLGSRTTLDVLDAEQDLLNARSAVINSEADKQIALYQLLQAMGLLTAERLGLNVPIYDPSEYYNLARSAPTPSSQRGQQLEQLMRRLGE